MADSELEKQTFVLGVLDTYHDFCKGERTTKAVREARATATDDDDDDGDPARVKIMRSYLPLLLKTLYGEDKVGKTYQDNIKKITDNEIKSVSTVEHSAVELFEKLYEDQLKANPDSQEFLTFDQIIDAYTNAPDKNNIPLWKKYRDGIHNHVLELSKSGRRFGKGKVSEEEEKLELKILSSFILNYFFFAENPPDGVYMTFDAGERIVGDIFHDRQNVKCVIFPETLADSATTSLGMLGGRSEYVFPVQDKTKPDVFTSNLFSKKSADAKYDIYFENKGFSDQNPYGFNLVIAKTDGKKLSLPFSPKQTEGPSVNYLIDILKTAENNAEAVKKRKPTDRKQYGYILKKGTILSVGEALDKDKDFREDFETTIGKSTNGLLPDLKRGGDHEAVLASKKAVNLLVDGKKKYQNFVFCTIDILCGLKSRLEGLNTIWQGKDKIILFRFPSVLPEDVQKGLFVEKGKETYDLLNKVQLFLTKTMTAELEVQIVNFESGLQGVVDYSDRNKENIPLAEFCELALNAMLRIISYDLVIYSEDLAENRISFKALEGADSVAFPENLLFYKAFNELTDFSSMVQSGDTYTIPVTVGSQTKVLDLGADNANAHRIYNKVVQDVKQYLNLDLNEATVENGVLKLNYKIQQDVVVGEDKKFTMKEHSVFRFNPAVFEKLYDCLMFVHDLTYKNEKRASRDYNKIMNKILTGDVTAPFNYFALVEDVVDQFNIQEYKNILRSILDFRPDIKQESKTKEEVEAVRRLYLVGEKDEDSEKRKNTGSYQDRQNGVVNNLLNFYQSLRTSGVLTEPLQYENYEAPAPLVGGGQRGGAGSSALQFYDLNDLLFKVSSMAASFIESVYSQEFQFYAYYIHITDVLDKVKNVLNRERIEQGELKRQIASAKSKLIDLVRQMNKAYNDLRLEEGGRATIVTGTAFGRDDPGKQINLSNWNSSIGSVLMMILQIKDTVTAGTTLDSIKQSFDTLRTALVNNTILQYAVKSTDTRVGAETVNREIVFPPIKLFLQVVFSDKYQFINEEDPYKRDEGGNYILHNGNKIFNKEHMCNSLYNDIGMIWQAGLFEIRQNKEYLYTYTLTDDILSYLLTLRLKTLLEDIDDGNNNNNENYEDEDEDEDENFNEVIARAEPQTISAFYRAQIIKSTLGDELTFFDSTQNTRLTVGSKTIRDKIKAFNKTITIGTTAANNISISTTILFVLTLLENIMNPTKVSFFLTNDYKNQLYQTKKDWKDKLNGVLDNLFLLLNIGFTENKTKLKLMPLAQQLGGAQTSNKTRKVKRRISRRKTLKQSHH